VFDHVEHKPHKKPKKEIETPDWDDISLHIKRYAVKFQKGRVSKIVKFENVIINRGIW